jgi:uncharacterized protein
VNDSQYGLLQQHKESPCAEILSAMGDDTVEKYVQKSILVLPGDDENYVKAYEMSTHIESFSASHLSLSIAPTTACNFRCPYCYEKNKATDFMDDKVISGLIDFINNHKMAKTLNITWYGGEPLLAFKQMKEIVARINSQCTAKLTSQQIVTNGYRINQEVIDFFKKYNFERIQITIDGPEEIHNKTRILCNGKGTYRKIMSNIEQILAQVPQTQVLIRVNVGKENQQGYSLLYKELNQTLKGNFSMYPGYVKIHNEENTGITCDSMAMEDIVTFGDNLEKEGVVKQACYPQLCRSKGCVATSVTAYVIGPLGELYKCWNDIGDTNMVVGYIDKEKLTNPVLFNQYMIDGRWTANETCKKCFFLPICDGGCAWQRVRNKFHHGSFNFCCSYKEKGIETILMQHFAKRQPIK